MAATPLLLLLFMFILTFGQKVGRSVDDTIREIFKTDKYNSLPSTSINTAKFSIEDNRNISTLQLFEVPVQCGYGNAIDIGNYATENNQALYAEFPWMAAILSIHPITGAMLYISGGSLIASTVVLTGAYGVKNLDQSTLIVRAGEWDIQSSTEVFPHQNIKVREVIIHEEFNAKTHYNNIALLIVEEPFQWMPNVRPICLPETHVNFDNTLCFATGWGKDRFGKDGAYQTVLKKINLPIVPHEQCQTNLRATHLGNYFQLHESFICAGGENGHDTCQRDGGSPLVCSITGGNYNGIKRFYLAGMVSWGIGCGRPNIPGVYVNIANLRTWINNKLVLKSINFTYFTS